MAEATGRRRRRSRAVLRLCTALLSHRDGRSASSRRGAADALAVVFAGSGILHLVVTDWYASAIPRRMPRPRAWVLATAPLEWACAYGLWRRRAWGVSLSVATLVGVFPANVQMALDAGTGRNRGPSDTRLVAYARLPLQLALIWAAAQARTRPLSTRHDLTPGR